MRLALISDIHGNLTALHAVLTEIMERQIEQIICLGDIFAGGPHPREVLQRIQSIGCPVIMGNNDDYMRILAPNQSEHDDPSAQKNHEISIWCAQQLTKNDQAFIQTFHSTLSSSLPDGQILLCYHGSPRSYREILTPTTPDEILEQAFMGHQADIFIGGHSHIQMYRRYRDKLVLNPGSVGLAMDRVFPFNEVRNPPWAEYAILTIGIHGLSVELRRIPFDVHAFIQSTLNSKMPHAEWSANQWKNQ